MGGIFIAAFLGTALIGLLSGFFIPGVVLMFFAWLNFLVLIVLLAAWCKADEGFTVSILITCIIFWLSAYGGRMLSLV